MSDAHADRLGPLDARLRAPELAAIEARLRAAADPCAETLRWLAEGIAEIEAWESDLEEVEREVLAGRAVAAVRAWLGKRGGTWRDRWAVGRTLGLEVVRERTELAIEAIGIRDELLLRRSIGDWSVSEPIPAGIVGHLTGARRWLTRWAAAAVMVAHAAAGGPPGPNAAAVVARARLASENAWVRDTCDGWLAHAAPSVGEAVLREGLAERGPDAFLTRRLRVERAVALGWDVPGDDPSEHVSIGLVAAMVRRGDGVALRALAGHDRWRVRLATLAYGQRAAGLAGFADLVEARLREDANPTVRAAAARAAAHVAAADPRARGALLAAIEAALHRDDAASEAVAAARRTLIRLGDPRRTAMYAALAPLVARIAPGTRRFVAWDVLGGEAPEDDVGAVLSEISHADWGLWADLTPRGVWIWRGERFGLRAWRLLHELGHPAPNKRQNFDHTVGRRVRGRIRAPSARMAQVTATQVPGEPTLLDRDGSWMPALPSVDDLLDLPSEARLYSVWGVTRLVPPRGVVARWVSRARVTWRYAWLWQRRTAALGAEEPVERGAYRRAAEETAGVQISFRPDGPVPPRVASIAPQVSLAGLGLGELANAVWAPTRTGQGALAWLGVGALGAMLLRAYVLREAIRRARAAIPLSIGGWGTRGKSGTERIKAAFFHGLGFPVFVKTTGCEAMFISARPGLSAREIFLFRPHDKSSIWEQADVVQQAAGMGARVMLWECMALRSHLVEVLQGDWMRDDLVTLTNAFPDHEDVQGPAGHDIATVISSFIPWRAPVVTTEVEFLPILRRRAEERGAPLDEVDPVEADLFGEDLLARFPYQEHPRNVALVARVAERLGYDRHLAVAMMADHVVPDLGVLRVYPVVRVAGRDLRFINGMSANERTGCVANWRRTGCDAISPDTEPDHAIVVVVNNRADRVARSEVFARILVQDLSADAFVWIGTNLVGLRGFVEAALEAHLATVEVQPAGVSPAQAEARLARWLAKLRIGAPEPRPALVLADAVRASIGLGPAGGALADAVAACLAAPIDPGRAIDETVADAALRDLFLAGDPVGGPEGIEVLAPPTADEAWGHWARAFGRLRIHVRLRELLQRGELTDAALRGVLRALFWSSIVVVEDAAATGDQIVVACARAVAPGRRCTVMGIQNIKGTGLDFAYRWVALGAVAPSVARARGPDPEARVAALRALLAHDDYGLVDAGLVVGALSEPAPGASAEEAHLRARVLAEVRDLHRARVDGLARVTQRRWWSGIVDVAERWLDPLHAIWRAWRARQVLRGLRAHTLSLAEASATMQALVASQKGGWLRG